MVQPTRVPFMKRFATLFGVVMVFGLAAAAPTQAADTGDSQIKATLLADAAAIQPGAEFTLGVRMKIQPHWHTYWISPGDSGDATRIKFTADGIAFGEIQWPIPSRFEGDGFVSYGYENEVLLMIPAKASKELKAGDRVTIQAEVNWLVCHETCVEGGAKLSITLPIESKAAPANEKLFGDWRGKLPLVGEAGAVAKVTQNKAADGSPVPSLTLTWKGPVKGVEWYPIADSALLLDKIEVKHEGDRTVITFRSEIFKPEKLPTGMIDSVVVFTDAQGRRCGITVPVGVLKAEK
ncbi:MAG: protein-disulfide reductase DsbD domain-containing protein [Phycisphaeraceae bacterium]